jgi:hypothetical protein
LIVEAKPNSGRLGQLDGRCPVGEDDDPLVVLEHRGADVEDSEASAAFPLRDVRYPARTSPATTLASRG